MAALLNPLPAPILLTSDHDYKGRKYWTLSIDDRCGKVMQEHADTRKEAIEVMAPLLASYVGVTAYYITEQE